MTKAEACRALKKGILGREYALVEHEHKVEHEIRGFFEKFPGMLRGNTYRRIREMIMEELEQK